MNFYFVSLNALFTQLAVLALVVAVVAFELYFHPVKPRVTGQRISLAGVRLGKSSPLFRYALLQADEAQYVLSQGIKDDDPVQLSHAIDSSQKLLGSAIASLKQENLYHASDL